MWRLFFVPSCFVLFLYQVSFLFRVGPLNMDNNSNWCVLERAACGHLRNGNKSDFQFRIGVVGAWLDPVKHLWDVLCMSCLPLWFNLQFRVLLILISSLFSHFFFTTRIYVSHFRHKKTNKKVPPLCRLTQGSASAPVANTKDNPVLTLSLWW